jgi:hypothetical protein
VPPSGFALTKLRIRVLAFFSSAPDETLLAGDIALKVGATPSEGHKINWQLRPLVRAGYLTVTRDRPKGNVAAETTYRAGPELLAVILHDSTHPEYKPRQAYALSLKAPKKIGIAI